MASPTRVGSPRGLGDQGLHLCPDTAGQRWDVPKLEGLGRGPFSRLFVDAIVRKGGRERGRTALCVTLGMSLKVSNSVSSSVKWR